MKSFTLFVLLCTGIFSGTNATPLSSTTFYNVRIKSFLATTDGKMTKIAWELTEMELGVACFLERSSDGIKYSVIGTYDIPEGFTGGMSAIDKEVKPGLYYYRLHMEKNGFIPFFSNIVSIRIDGTDAARNIKVINPFRNNLMIQGSFSGNPLQVEVTDINGALRMVKTVLPDPGSSFISFEATQLRKGVYFVRIKENALDATHVIMTRKVIKDQE